MEEMLDVVDAQNCVIGSVTYDEVYAEKLPHRIVHVFVLNSDDHSVYLQQRALTKQFLPGYFCTSAGGHVRSGETYAEAAHRELTEELGLQIPVRHVHSCIFESEGHKRHIQIYVAYADGGISFEDGEVMSGKFVTLPEIPYLLKNEKIHPQLALCMEWFLDNNDDLW